MRISLPRSRWIQQTLFDPYLRGHGHIRTVIGETVEILSAEMLGGVRHRTSGGDYCPDVSLPDAGGEPWYFECRAAGRNRETFVYEGRLEADRFFTLGGRSLFYLIWHHFADTKSVDTVESLRTLVASTMRAVYVVPFAHFDRIATARPVEKLNSAYGLKPGCLSAPKVYGAGRRVKLAAIESYRLFTYPAGLDKADWPLTEKIMEKISKK
jgi:hypothetical protein